MCSLAALRIITFCHSGKHKQASQVQTFKKTTEFFLCKPILNIGNLYAKNQVLSLTVALSFFLMNLENKHTHIKKP